MNFLNEPRKEQFDTMNALLASIASNTGDSGISIKNWKDVQKIVRMGLADSFFAVGDQLVSLYGDKEMIWGVIGIDHDKPSDSKYKHSLTIQARDCLFDAQFGRQQAIYHAETELLPGTYHFLDEYNDVNLEFTLSKPIPEKGVAVLSEDRNTVTTYLSQDSEELIETAEVKEGSGGVELVETNHASRRYGSNNYVESSIRQFLNSDEEVFNWEPQTIYDRKPSNTPYNGNGFLNQLDSELVNVLGKVDKQVARNNINEAGGQDIFSDKVFLLSRKEVGLGGEGDISGESIYPFYSKVTNAERIKQLNGSNRLWWLRSPGVSSSSLVRLVSTSGVLNDLYARSLGGVSPACVII